MGVPAVIASKGVKELVTYRLSEEELKDFQKSVNVLREVNKKMLENLK